MDASSKPAPKTVEQLLALLTSIHNDAFEKNRHMFLDITKACNQLKLPSLTPEDRKAIDNFSCLLTDKLETCIWRTRSVGHHNMELLKTFFAFPSPDPPDVDDKDAALIVPTLTPKEREFRDALTKAIDSGDVFEADQLLCSTDKSWVSNVDVMHKRSLLKACLEARNADLAHMLIAKLGITRDVLCCHNDIKWGTLAANVSGEYCQAFIELFDLPRTVFHSVHDMLGIDNTAVGNWLVTRFQCDQHDFAWAQELCSRTEQDRGHSQRQSQCNAGSLRAADKTQPLYSIIKRRLQGDDEDKFKAFMQIISGMMYHEFRTCFIVNLGRHNILRQCILDNRGAQLDFLVDHFQVDKVTLYRLIKEMVDPIANRESVLPAGSAQGICMLKRVVNLLAKGALC
jgi:hypothetical protein